MDPIIRKKPRNTQGENNWSLTLADMMTLLLCFFVLIVAVAKVDPHRYEAMSDILAEAMKGKSAPSVRESKNKNLPPAERKKKNLFELQLELAKLINLDQKVVTLKLRPEAVAINLKGAVFFKSGSAVLTPKAEEILAKLSLPLKLSHFLVTVEGHTDNIPIHSTKYPSNWELSSARASSVARFLIEKGFPKADIKVVGLADTKPLAPNMDAKGRALPKNQAKNRRITLLVAPK